MQLRAKEDLVIYRRERDALIIPAGTLLNAQVMLAKAKSLMVSVSDGPFKGVVLDAWSDRVEIVMLSVIVDRSSGAIALLEMLDTMQSPPRIRITVEAVLDDAGTADPVRPEVG